MQPQQRQALAELAVAAMRARGLVPEFPDAVWQQLAAIDRAAAAATAALDAGASIADLTALPWCSIDNDDSRDLDQLTVGQPLADGATRIHVAIADVDTLVPSASAIDRHAGVNTTSVYTSARIFPMLPERLSTDLTSLNPHQVRLAVVTSFDVDRDGAVQGGAVLHARVRNQARLAYDSVTAWLDGAGALPAAAAAVPGMDQQLRLQDAAAQRLRTRRQAQGALDFQSVQTRAVFDGERVVEIRAQVHNRARQLIQEFMVATNGVGARFLAERGVASIRRVVRAPERWPRMVEVAAEHGHTLPPAPDAAALQRFLAEQRQRDPLRFPDLSLVIVKLLGAGEYVVDVPGTESPGHFGLAVRDYAHATAPNRRYPDLITSRLLKATLAQAPSPYPADDLQALAAHCTRQEDAANKVERQMRKSEAALVLGAHLGEAFDGIVTGAGKGNTWIRIFRPPAEGRLTLRGVPPLKVGQTVRARLRSVDVERGYLDFEVD